VYLLPEGYLDATNVVVGIYAYKSDASSRQIAADYIQFWPVDGGLRKYKCLDYPTTVGQIWDDYVTGNLYWCAIDGSGKRAIYNGLGSHLLLNPGKVNVIAGLNLASGTSWLIDDQLEIFLYAYHSKRNL
jgi:hypothetical protein